MFFFFITRIIIIIVKIQIKMQIIFAWVKEKEYERMTMRDYISPRYA